jgi:hypothetical protein
MKKLISIWFVALAGLTARASNDAIQNAFYTSDFVASISGVNTNSVIGTNYCGDDLYKTFYFNSFTNLNGSKWEVDFSGDTTNWIVYSSNTITNQATAASQSTNQLGHQNYYRIVLSGTNVYGKFVYTGGR